MVRFNTTSPLSGGVDLQATPFNERQWREALASDRAALVASSIVFWAATTVVQAACFAELFAAAPQLSPSGGTGDRFLPLLAAAAVPAAVFTLIRGVILFARGIRRAAKAISADDHIEVERLVLHDRSAAAYVRKVRQQGRELNFAELKALRDRHTHAQLASKPLRSRVSSKA